MRFPYVQLPKETGGVFLPMIAIRFPFGDYYCLVDSGADFCYFHGGIGEALGLAVRQGQPTVSRGITGTIFTAYAHRVRYQIGREAVEAKVNFSCELGTPFGILGRVGFFDQFHVCISQREKFVELQE